MRRFVLKFLVVFWMCLIFFFSNQPAIDSTRTSDGFISRTIGNVYKIFNHDISDNDIIVIQEKYTYVVRKIAHFSLYLVFGVFVFSLFSVYSFDIKHLIIYSLLFCMLYAISDEVHQLFISGRSGNIFDVFIDSCGSFSGILLCCLFRKISLKN